MAKSVLEEIGRLLEDVGHLKGTLEQHIVNSESNRVQIVQRIDSFEHKMDAYMEKDLEAHAKIEHEVHKLATTQAVEKMKLGSIVAMVSVALNEGIRRILG